MRIIKIFNFLKKTKKENIKCIRCNEINIKRDADFITKFNGFELPICQHHMKELIETLKKDKEKINLLEDIQIIKK